MTLSSISNYSIEKLINISKNLDKYMNICYYDIKDIYALIIKKQ